MLQLCMSLFTTFWMGIYETGGDGDETVFLTETACDVSMAIASLVCDASWRTRERRSFGCT